MMREETASTGNRVAGFTESGVLSEGRRALAGFIFPED